MPRYRQKKSLALVFLIVLMIAAIGGAVYFYLDKEVTVREIAAIDSSEYAPLAFEKGPLHEAKGASIAAEIIEALDENSYHTPHGFSIVSYSKKWKDKKLVDIYEELLKNMHGDEMMYVGEVVVYSGASDLNTENTTIAGTQSSRHDYYPVYFELPSLVPEALKYTIRPKVSVIQLFNMDKYDSAAEAAKTIAHEYGHHYTMYYFLKDNESALSSKYYELRDLKNAGRDVLFDNWDEYLENHEWDIYELAAEDYVQLMGSPNAKETKDYKDIFDLLKSGAEDYKPVINDRIVNVFPQENIYIPLADEVLGLRDYYYSFIGKKSEFPPEENVDFKLKIAKNSNNGYDITWKKTSTDKDALYTLVCYNKNGDPFWPVKAIRGNERAIARIGVVSNMYYRWTDGIPDEDRIFKLYLMLPDGRMQSSEPFHASF